MTNDLETAIKDAADVAAEAREASVEDGEILDRLKAMLKDIFQRIFDRVFPPYPAQPLPEEPEVEPHTDTDPPCEPG